MCMCEWLGIVKNAREIDKGGCDFINRNVFPTFGDGVSCSSIDCAWCRFLSGIWLDEEYKEPPKPEVDWDNVPVDTLVQVREYEDEELGELGKVFSNVYVDRKVLVRNIREAMKDKSQVTLQDVVEQFPLKQGLPELFAYFGALGQFPHKSVDEEKRQAIVFDYENNKRIRIPKIIISI